MPLGTPFSRTEDYCGEWYTPKLPAEDYHQFHMKEKGYAAIAMLLHIAIGLMPAMGLNVFYAAIFYMAGLVLIIYLTILLYRGPAQKQPLSEPQHRKFARRPRILVNVQRMLAMLTLMMVVIANFQYQLGIRLWFLLQVALLLLEALSLQFLYRLQRDLKWEISGTKPEEYE